MRFNVKFTKFWKSWNCFISDRLGRNFTFDKRSGTTGTRK